MPLDIPRDRDGSFEPQLVAKHQTRWTGFDDKILSLYARGMTVREIQSHLEEMYGTEVSPTLISSVTDAVMCDGTPYGDIPPISQLCSIFWWDIHQQYFKPPVTGTDPLTLVQVRQLIESSEPNSALIPPPAVAPTTPALSPPLLSR